MGVGEDCATLACHGAAVSMVAASLLCVLDLAFSASLLQSTAESVLLLLGGFLCLQGETRLFYSHHEVIRENCGFALKPLGRGAAYLISGLYCVGARSAFLAESDADGTGHSPAFGLLWYICCLLMLCGGGASLWTWRAERRSSALDAGLSTDFDNYYISS
jgi:hypothetical protein